MAGTDRLMCGYIYLYIYIHFYIYMDMCDCMHMEEVGGSGSVPGVRMHGYRAGRHGCEKRTDMRCGAAKWICVAVLPKWIPAVWLPSGYPYRQQMDTL